jgi:hypothetical protein
MSKNYLIFGVIGFIFIIAYNALLIKRDNALYDAYYHRQALENLKRPPISEIR